MTFRLTSGGLPLMLLAAIMASSCGGGGSNIGSGSNGGGGTKPQITSTVPSAGESGTSRTSRITATFSTAMESATLNATSFSASSSVGPVSGIVSYSGNTASFVPSGSLPANTLINVTITTAVKDLAGDSMAAKYVWSFTSGGSNDTTPPTVSSTAPTNGATGYATNQNITAIFSKPMAAETVNTTTFSLKGPSGAIGGSVSLLNNVATFNPTSNLAPETTFTATITSGVHDVSGNSMASSYIWSFTTGTNQNTTPPRITLTDPAASATGVPTNSSVTVTFSDNMNVSTLTPSTIYLKEPNGTVVPAAIAYANKVVVLDPTGVLAANTTYTATVTTSVKNSANIPLATSSTWSFKTAAVLDTNPPTVTSTTPANASTNVFLNQSVNATFSKAMRATTISTSTFSVAGISGTVSYNPSSRIATFVPSADLAPNKVYTATITPSALDSAGVGLTTPKIWTFTTGVQRAQNSINLGSASSYAVLAGSTVTNGGPTVVNGDVGVYPGTTVTGFPPGIVNGSMHAGDAAAKQAKSDLLAGQLDAAGRLGGATLPGDLSGLTFTPGLYKNSSSVMLSAGNVTLDAQGDANAVFIFQMATTLTTSTGTQVVLAGGAQASNIYWSVGSSATLGVNSIFKGIILAQASISVNTGATNDGTFLTHIGAVTLQSNKVTDNLVIKR